MTFRKLLPSSASCTTSRRLNPLHRWEAVGTATFAYIRHPKSSPTEAGP